MFLNDLGQPQILNANRNYGPYEQHNGPLLVTAAAFKNHVKPANWGGFVIGSEKDIHDLQTTFPELYTRNCSYCVLRPNEPTEIEYANSKITLMLLPAGARAPGESLRKATTYYLENGYTRAIIVDEVPATLDFIPKANASFHRGLRDGIDVMYIDNPVLDCYKEDTYALMQLIRPKHIYGVRQDNLPKWLLDLCVRRDLYASYEC
ncbi:uncharacterized protein [Drosophila tropicalis]|uniref:uncharacterized protein n=1 Tax=Drosophila tropicalis TaxID=46794 RepID=UPI0035AC2039